MSVFTLFLTACGGGESDINFSFIKELARNGQIYICRTQKAADACENENNKDCSACEVKNLSSNSDTNHSIPRVVIGITCAMRDAATYQVTQTGCILQLATGQQTAVCNGTSLKMMSATALTKEQLIAGGTTFSGNLIVNGSAIQCA